MKLYCLLVYVGIVIKAYVVIRCSNVVTIDLYEGVSKLRVVIRKSKVRNPHLKVLIG
jgi:hypothetical protein